MCLFSGCMFFLNMRWYSASKKRASKNRSSDITEKRVSIISFSVYPWDTSSHFSLILFCPFWFCPGTPSPFPRHRRGFDSVLPTRSDFYEVFLPILPFLLSLSFLSSSNLSTSFCNPSDPGRYPSAGIRNERTREKTNSESRCLKGRKSSGRRRVKGRKNIPESSAESTSIHWFQIISSLSIFYHRRPRFLERNSCKFLQHDCHEKR